MLTGIKISLKFDPVIKLGLPLKLKFYSYFLIVVDCTMSISYNYSVIQQSVVNFLIYVMCTVNRQR